MNTVSRRETPHHEVARLAHRSSWRVACAVAAVLCMGSKCLGGDGSGGDPPVIQFGTLDGRCITVAGKFPSGFAMLPEGTGRAALVQFFPQSLLHLDIDQEPPRITAPAPLLPDDSDGDGVEDGQQVLDAGFRFRLRPVLGDAVAVSEELVLVTASNFEEVLFFDPRSGVLVPVEVENPTSQGAYWAGDSPFLPAEGTRATRTAVSSKRCIYPGSRLDSLGDSIEAEPMCDASAPSYFSRFTESVAIAGDRLFVATANLKRSSEARFYPGTVLVYDLDSGVRPSFARPNTDTPLLFTTGFNPTHVTSHTNALGRELVLVSATGAIGLETGAANVKTDSAIDVIDVVSLERVAIIPLGRAGAFNHLSIDRTGQIAAVGAASQRHVYAVDLRALDDPGLYPALDPTPVLDGSDPRFKDARIFTGSDPFVLPHRVDGAPEVDCAGQTSVSFNDAGTSLYAVDFCDGTLAIVNVDVTVDTPIPSPRERFQLFRMEPVAAPLTPGAIDELRAPSHLRVRPGRPGVDFTTPDVYWVAGLPEGSICGVRIESP